MFTVKYDKNLALVTICVCLSLLSCCSSSSIHENIVKANKAANVTAHPPPAKIKAGNESSSKVDSSLEDRMNFNVQHAQADGTNQGGYSYTQHDSYAGQIGIQSPGEAYQPVYSGAQSSGVASASGENPPQTWANTQSQVAPGQSSGSGEAGVSGGEGQAYESSYSTNQEVPLGDSGSVLYSNLNPKHKRPSNTTSATPNGAHNKQNQTLHLQPNKGDDAIHFANDNKNKTKILH